MKILYYSTLPFTDCDFPLIREYQKRGVECKYMLSLLCTKLSGGLFKINEQILESNIIEGKRYKEFEPYKEYIDLSDIYVFNRIKRGLHPCTILLYIKLVFFIWKFKPDVIHITHPLWGAEILLYIFASKIVLTVHDPFLHSGEENSTEQKARRIAFSLCKKLILLNNKQKENFISKYKIKKEKVFVNSLGVYDCLNIMIRENDWGSSEKFRGNLQVIQDSPNYKYILMFGRISPYKGIHVLCKAMQIVGERYPDIRCIIAGSGKIYFDFSPYENEKNINLINKYIQTDELVHLIKGSLFTVCPYKDATQSGVIFSSFALNKPVVASNVGALGDSVKEGITGLLVQPNDPRQLAEAIIKMINSPSLISSMEKNIKYIYGKGEGSWTSIASKYISIYNA